MKRIVACVVFSLLVAGVSYAQGAPAAKKIVGKDHWTVSNGLKIYLWEKYPRGFEKTFAKNKKIVLLVHGATWTGRPDFDLQIRDYSLMDFLAKNGYDVWAIDIHGYGRSEKTDKDWSDTESASGDINAAVDYVSKLRGVDKISILGWSWGTQTTGLFTMKHPEKVEKLILFAMPWGRKSLPSSPQLPKEQYRINDEKAARSDFIAGQYEEDVVALYVKEALAEAPKSPNGVRVDGMTKLTILTPRGDQSTDAHYPPRKGFCRNRSRHARVLLKAWHKIQKLRGTARRRACDPAREKL